MFIFLSIFIFCHIQLLLQILLKTISSSMYLSPDQQTNSTLKVACCGSHHLYFLPILIFLKEERLVVWFQMHLLGNKCHWFQLPEAENIKWFSDYEAKRGSIRKRGWAELGKLIFPSRRLRIWKSQSGSELAMTLIKMRSRGQGYLVARLGLLKTCAAHTWWEELMSYNPSVVA